MFPIKYNYLNKMKKILLAVSLLFSFNLISAQDLVKKIPSNAFAVATIKGDEVFKLMFVKDFNESFVGKKVLESVSKEKNSNYTSIEDFGISLKKNMYYFSQVSDSITYNCFLIPIQDAGKFDTFLKGKKENIKLNGATRTFVTADSTSIMMWNNDIMYIVNGNIRSSFFADSTHSVRYGIKDIKYQPEYSDTTYTDSAAVAVDAAVMAVPTEAAADEIQAQQPKPVKIKKQNSTAVKKTQKKKVLKKKATKKKTSKAKKTIVKKSVEENDEIDQPIDIAMGVTDTTQSEADEKYSVYQQEIAVEDVKKRKLAFVWMTAQADRIFNTNYESISSNKSYNASLDEKAIAELWISSLQDVYNSIAPEFGTYGKVGLMKGYGSLNAKLFMDKQSFRISTGLELAKEQADSYKKIMNRKLNKNFLKYVNSDKAIGFMSYSIDSKAYLEEFPKLLKQTYGSILGGKMDEEIELGSDLFSLLLDEEAVSKVVKGDALFVINGLNSKEVTYTTYEYDDDYNRKEVTKTKKETLPDFLFMFSSEDTRLIDKLIKYGIHKNYVSVDQNIYKIEEKKSPIDIYFMIKDGIVFFGNSIAEMKSINSNAFDASISKTHKTLLSKNNFSFLFNAKNLVGKVPEEEIGGAESVEKFNTTLSKMGNIYIKSNPIKGNIVSADISAEIPNRHENALKYLFSLIENASK